MKKIIIIGLTMMIAAAPLFALQDEYPVSIGSRFPELKAETLAGEDITYPDDMTGTVSLLLFAFERGTQEKIDTWLKPFDEKYAENDSVNVYEIPMLKGRYRLMSAFIDGGMRSGIPEEKHDYVSTYYGNLDKYKESLGMTDNAEAYVFLLDRDGTIVWRESGSAAEEKLAELFEKIEVLSGGNE